MSKKKIGSLLGFEEDSLIYEIGEYFSTKDKVGIEIEIEGWSGFYKDVNAFEIYWKIKDDHSLRNGGAEIVLIHPLFGKDLEKAFDCLKEFFETYEDIIISIRCSVHVHIDVRDMDEEHFKNFILMYMCVENLLFHVSGNRNKSIYCVPYSETEDSINIFNLLNRKNIGENINNLATGKYASLNTEAMYRFGSVEFRHHEGTNDSDRIKSWVKALLNLKINSRAIDIPIEVLPEHISKKGFVEYVKEVFGDVSDMFLYNGFQIDLIKGIRHAQNVIYYDNIRKNDWVV